MRQPPDGVARDPERSAPASVGTRVPAAETAVTRRPRRDATSPHEQLPTLRLPPVEARALRREVEGVPEDEAMLLHSGEIVLEPEDDEGMMEAVLEPPPAPRSDATTRSTLPTPSGLPRRSGATEVARTSGATPDAAQRSAPSERSEPAPRSQRQGIVGPPPRTGDARERMPTLRVATLAQQAATEPPAEVPRAAAPSSTLAGGPRLHARAQPMPAVLRDGPRTVTVPSAEDPTAIESSSESVATRRRENVVVPPREEQDEAAIAVPLPASDVATPRTATRRWLLPAIAATALLTFGASWFLVPTARDAIARSWSPSVATWVGVTAAPHAAVHGSVPPAENTVALAGLHGSTCATPSVDVVPAIAPVDAAPIDAALVDAALVDAPAIDAAPPIDGAPTLEPLPTITPIVDPLAVSPLVEPAPLPVIPDPAAAPPTTVAIPSPTPAIPEPIALEPVAAAAPEPVVAAAAPSPKPRARSRSRKSSRGAPAPRVATPPPPPPPSKPTATSAAPDPVALLREAEKAFADGRYGTALRNAQRSAALQSDIRATRIVALAACKLGRTDVALSAIERLPVGQRRSVRNTCRDSGVKV